MIHGRIINTPHSYTLVLLPTLSLLSLFSFLSQPLHFHPFACFPSSFTYFSQIPPSAFFLCSPSQLLPFLYFFLKSQTPFCLVLFFCLQLCFLPFSFLTFLLTSPSPQISNWNCRGHFRLSRQSQTILMMSVASQAIQKVIKLCHDMSWGNRTSFRVFYWVLLSYF